MAPSETDSLAEQRRFEPSVPLAVKRCWGTPFRRSLDGAAPLTALSDALRQAGRTREALETAERALGLAEADPTNKRQRLYTLGRVGQLARIERDNKRALEVARQGFALATELDDLRERAKFKSDEVHALILLYRPDEAVAAARVCRVLARQAHDDLADLLAAGSLVQALTLAAQTREADAIAQCLRDGRAGASGTVSPR
jgi:tetratricopeptide (TPR) repeat protein